MSSIRRPNRHIVFWLVIALVVAIILVGFLQRFTVSPVPPPGKISVSNILGTSTSEEFNKVSPGREFRFPGDHGTHEGYRQQWWYFTGNLVSSDGSEFGYQLTFFRFEHGMNPDLPEQGWNAPDSWMAHLAVSDLESGRFYSFEDFSRGALDLAGANASPFSVWINGWSARETEDGKPDCPGCLHARLLADAGDFSIDLDVASESPPILHGDHGYSIKSGDGTVASYYYSYPDLATTGELVIGGRNMSVSGSSWMDREWSSGVLKDGQSGWDWFSLHLDSGHRMMLFQVRQENGEHFRSGTLIAPDGQVTAMGPGQVSMEPMDYWRSSRSGAEYPVVWKLEWGDGEDSMVLVVETSLENQELDHTFTYYEGVIRASGKIGDAPVTGRGYMELTGYVE